MTTVPPRTPQEAAMLGLLMPNQPRGIFGSGGRRTSGRRAVSPPDPTTPTDTLAAPPITEAPPPPANWSAIVGPDLLGKLPQRLQTQTLPPAPPMRAELPAPGMFGHMGGDKIANRGAALPEAHSKGKKGIDWRMIAGIVGDALGSLNGQPPIFAQNMWKERQAQADHSRRLRELAQEWQFRNSQPDYATVGNRRFSYNPATGQAQTLYTAPSEAEDYAAALGAEPGTAEYDLYLQDYILRHSGPTATANAMDEEDNRQGNRIDLENRRYGNRVSLEGVRQGNRVQLRGMPTYRDTHPRPSTPRASGKGGSGVREGQTATNPQTGQKVVYRGGKWVPMK